MKSSLFQVCVCACLLSACASEHDHFYTLNTLPEGAHAELTAPVVHVILSVSVPALVDRAELVVNTSRNGILVLDHERWAAPLSEQVTQTLARDLENRRSGVLVGDRGFGQGTPLTTIKVDIVRMTAQTGGVSLEARWRIANPASGLDELGDDVFASAGDGGYANIAKSYSVALGALADKLAAGMGAR